MNGLLNESIVVKKYDFEKPDIHEIDYLLDDIIKDCRKKYFHTFEYRLVHDINFTNFSNNKNLVYFRVYAGFEADNEIDTSSIGNKTTNV